MDWRAEQVCGYKNAIRVIKEGMHLKENEEEYVKGFGRGKGKKKYGNYAALSEIK